MVPVDDSRDALVALDATAAVRSERVFTMPAHAFWRDEKAAVSAIDHIEAALRQMHGRSSSVRFSLAIPRIRADAFSVGACSDQSGIIVSLGGLIQECRSLDFAIQCIRIAFAKGFHLHVVHVGSRPCHWMFERSVGRGPDEIVLASRHGALFGRWRSQRHVYKRNELIERMW